MYDYNPMLLSFIQPQGGLKVHDDMIRKGDGYETCVHLYSYKMNVDDFWIYGLLNIEDAIVSIDISTVENDYALDKMTKALAEQERRYYDIRDKAEKRKAKSVYTALNSVLDEITEQGEIIKTIHIRYYLSAGSVQELNIKTKNLLNKLKALGYKASIFLNEQEEEWQSLFLSHSQQQKLHNKRVGQPLPTMSLAGGYPFHFTSLNDERGLFLGTSLTGGNVIFDSFHRDEMRKSYNVVLVGKQGAGKSVTLKKLCENNAIVGNTIRILDVTGEFRTLIKALGGKSIALDGSDGMINPFQIMATVTDKKTYKVINDASFHAHISKLGMMYKFLSPNASDDTLREFEKLVLELYKEYNIEVDRATEYPVTSYPTMSQFLDFIKINFYEDLEKEIIKKYLSEGKQKRIESIILTIENLVNYYGKMFDGHSSFSDITNEQIVSFEIKGLSEFDPRIFNTQIFNILTMLWNNMINQGSIEKDKFENGLTSKDDTKKYVLLIDEAHLFIKSSNETALDYLIRFSREARKYFGGLIFATQNIRDVVPTDVEGEVFSKIKTLFELTQYKFIMQQDSNAIPVIRDIFGESLSDSEIARIPRLKTGETILSISGVNNIAFNIEIDDEEERLFKGGL